MSGYRDTARRTRRSRLNPVRLSGGVANLRVVNASRGFVGEALVDEADLTALRAFGRHWRAAWHASTGQFMVVANAKIEGRWTGVLLHRLIMGAPAGLDVDHINHSMLDCRRANLRLCTRSENLQNRRGAMSTSTSGLRGVSWDRAREKWRAHLTIKGRYVDLGRFESRDAAHSAAVVGRATLMTHSQTAEGLG